MAPTPTSLEIATAATLRSVSAVAADLGIDEEHLEHYGRGVAKIDLAALDAPDPARQDARYVVVLSLIHI